MSCGTRLTAVRVGLSIVALDGEVMKTPASMACSHSKECYIYIAVSYQRLYLYRSDNAYIDRRKLRHKIIVISPGCNVAFFLQILHTSHCLSHASSSLTHCVYITTHFVRAVSSQVPTPQRLPSHIWFVTSPVFCLFVQCGEPALQIAVCEGHLDVVKVLVQVCRDLHMESEIDQYYMDLADDRHIEHILLSQRWI